MIEPYENQVDRAVAQRLAKLRDLPADVSSLDAKLRSHVGHPAETSPGLASHNWRWRIVPLRPLRAIAASLVLLSGIAVLVVLLTSGRGAQAEIAEMARVHEDMVSGKIPVMQVDSIDAANRMLAGELPGGPALPQVPQSHVMACCMKSVHNKKVACVLLKDENVPVTLAVASAADMKLPTAPVENHNGIEYRVQHIGNLSMVMTQSEGRWLCLIGQLPAERLIDLAVQVRF